MSWILVAAHVTFGVNAQTYPAACNAVKYQCGMELREDCAADMNASNPPSYFHSHGLKDTHSLFDI